jgi:hypothetical protein
LSRLAVLSSRKVELRETREAIKEMDGRGTSKCAAVEWNVIARRPKADVAIQSRRS